MSYIPINLSRFGPTGFVDVSGSFRYKNTDDTLATITASGYFDPALSDTDNIAGQIELYDLLYVIGSDGSELVKVSGLDPITVLPATVTNEGTLTTTWSGIWAAPQSGDVTYQLDGHQALINVPTTFANATIGAAIVSDSALPAAMRPAADITIPVFVKDDQAAGDASDGTCVIKTTGIIEFYLGRGVNGSFAGTSATGTSGIYGLSLSYYV